MAFVAVCILLNKLCCGYWFRQYKVFSINLSFRVPTPFAMMGERVMNMQEAFSGFQNKSVNLPVGFVHMLLQHYC